MERRRSARFRGTLWLLVSIILIVSLDHLGLIDPTWLGAPVQVMQAVRVCLVIAVVTVGVRPLTRFLEHRYGGDWQWLERRRWRLVFWYLAIEAMLLWGTL